MLRKILLLMSSFTLIYCENTRNQSASFNGQEEKTIQWGDDNSDDSDKDGDGSKSSNYEQNKNSKKSGDFQLAECELDLSLADTWQGLSLPIEVEGKEADLCEALKKTEKKSAVVYFLDEDCEECSQEMRNVYLAIQRNDFRNDIGLIVIGYDDKEIDTVDEQAPGSVFAIDTKKRLIKSIPDDILEERENERHPLLLGVNGDLGYKFVHTETYLEVVNETIELLQDFDGDVEGQPIEKETSWGGENHQGTGLIDVIPVH